MHPFEGVDETHALVVSFIQIRELFLEGLQLGPFAYVIARVFICHVHPFTALGDIVSGVSA